MGNPIVSQDCEQRDFPCSYCPAVCHYSVGCPTGIAIAMAEGSGLLVEYRGRESLLTVFVAGAAQQLRIGQSRHTWVRPLCALGYFRRFSLRRLLGRGAEHPTSKVRTTRQFTLYVLCTVRAAARRFMYLFIFYLRCFLVLSRLLYEVT